jgi:hypothetical protein
MAGPVIFWVADCVVGGSGPPSFCRTFGACRPAGDSPRAPYQDCHAWPSPVLRRHVPARCVYPGQGRPTATIARVREALLREAPRDVLREFVREHRDAVESGCPLPPGGRRLRTAVSPSRRLRVQGTTGAAAGGPEDERAGAEMRVSADKAAKWWQVRRERESTRRVDDRVLDYYVRR